MTNALTKTEKTELVPADVTPGDLQSALAGDLKRLTPEGRLKFYGALCELTGLNPLSKPFDWLELQGKLILYANKGCAEQLRKLHGVSVEIAAREMHHGCLVVRVKATTKDGRIDESIAAVPFNERNPLEAANAMMKCETKAKRRVTLSICGLGLLDESELDNTVRERRTVAAVVTTEGTVGDQAAQLNQMLEDKSPAPAQASEPGGSGDGEGQDAPAAPASQPEPAPQEPEEEWEPPPAKPAKPELPQDVQERLAGVIGPHVKDALIFLRETKKWLEADEGFEVLTPEQAKKIIAQPKPFLRAIGVKE